MINLLEIKKDKQKYLLVTNIETLSVYEEVLIEFSLLSKRDIEEKRFEEIKKYATYINNYHIALKYLKRPRTKKELSNYLKKQDIFDIRIIENLEKKGFLNDKLYMEEYIQYQKNYNLKGPLLIKKGLNEKGIFDEFIYGDEEENIAKLTEKYLKNNKNKNTKALNQGLFIHLANKGYHPIYTNYEGNDLETIKKDFQKILAKYEKKYEGYILKQKIYASLLNKGYASSLINTYLSKLN